jgi:DNA processing protein
VKRKPPKPVEGQVPAAATLTGQEKTVFTCIGADAKHIDAIMNESRMTAGALSGILIALELKGLVKQLPGKYYVREDL